MRTLSGKLFNINRKIASAFRVTVAVAMAALCLVPGNAAMAQVNISPSPIPAGIVGTPYNQSLGASGGAAPYTYSNEVGRLPNVLTLTPGGTLSGTPQLATVPFEIWATDANGREGVASSSAWVMSYGLTLNATFPVAAVNQPYSVTIGVTGGTAPYTCALMSGALPAGLATASNCIISGTPTTAGTSTFTLQGTDSAAGVGNQTFTLTVGNVAPNIAYSPPAGSTANFTGTTTPGSNGIGLIVATPWGGMGTGVAATTTLNSCGLGSVTGDGSFGSVAAISLSFSGTSTIAQNINLSCMSGTQVTAAVLTCQENAGGSGNLARSWPLNCPAGITVPGAPAVTSISPGSGPVNGGTRVTITGTGFVNGATVTVGGAPATAVTWVSATSITASTPEGTTGAKNVVVTNPDQLTGFLPRGFTYVEATSIPSLSEWGLIMLSGLMMLFGWVEIHLGRRLRHS